jgi:hypothetical protein
MGKVKAWAQDEFEKSFAIRELDFGSRDVLRKVPLISKEDWVAHGMANQQDWAQYEAEFSAWLDAYEKSFGDNL